MSLLECGDIIVIIILLPCIAAGVPGQNALKHCLKWV